MRLFLFVQNLMLSDLSQISNEEALGYGIHTNNAIHLYAKGDNAYSFYMYSIAFTSNLRTLINQV